MILRLSRLDMTRRLHNAARPHRRRIQGWQHHRRCPPSGGQQGGAASVPIAERGRDMCTHHRHHRRERQQPAALSMLVSKHPTFSPAQNKYAF
eukprot:scaffold2616_cov106-Isochrysis_galbana.AAC.1